MTVGLDARVASARMHFQSHQDGKLLHSQTLSRMALFWLHQDARAYFHNAPYRRASRSMGFGFQVDESLVIIHQYHASLQVVQIYVSFLAHWH